jgi:hypothetical protein
MTIRITHGKGASRLRYASIAKRRTMHLLMAALGVVNMGPAHAQSASCGANAEEVQRTETTGAITLSCRCVSGYKRVGNGCALAPTQQPDQGAIRKSYPVIPAAVRGEVYAVTKDGHRIPITQSRVLTIDTTTEIVVGPGGRVQFILPDETIFTLGPNSDMVLDEFVYDPTTNATAFSANFAMGTFRFITGHVASHDPMKMRLKVAVGTIGIRGTDFEGDIASDGSGAITLYSGELAITPANGSAEFIMRAGTRIRFSSAGIFSGPEPVAQ